MKVFLGGTCNGTTWRDELIKEFERLHIDYFNPVVKDWTPECQAIEEDEKNNKCNCHLYVITKEMMGTYSIAEIINSAWQSVVYGTYVNFVVFVVLDEGTWQKHELKSFDAVMNMIWKIAPHNSLCSYVKNMKQVAELFIMQLRQQSNDILSGQ